MKTFLPIWRATTQWWLSALLLVLGTVSAQAQVDTYLFATSSGTFTPITGGTNAGLLADDALSSAIPLGFTFQFDGVSYTSAIASSNGYLSFGTSPTSFGYNNTLATTDASGDKPLLAPFWDDLTGGSAGSPAASYLTTGTAPNRVFTFQWLNWTTLSDTGPTMSFQVKLFETTNVIQFVYRPEANPLTFASASIGLAGSVVGSTPSDFLSVSAPTATATVSSTTENDNIGAVPPAGQIYSFTPAPPAACATPRNLAATVTPTTAVLRWTVNGGTGPFTIQYGLPGFNPAIISSSTNLYTTLTSATTSTNTITGLPPATTYQFYVTQNCGGTAGNSNRSNAGSFTTQIVNDEPCGATPMIVANTCTPVNGTTTGATTTNATGISNPGNCNGFNFTPFDVWFSFTTAATGPTATAVRISVTGSTANVLEAFSAASCAGPFTSLSCVGSSSNMAAPNLDLTGLTASTTYYVRVFNYDDFQPALGPFTICAVPVPNCPAPTGVTVSSVTNTTATVSWLAGTTTGSTYTVLYGPGNFTPPSGGTSVTGLSGTTTSLTGLTPNTAYSVYVQQVCGGFNGASIYTGPIAFNTPLTAPLNDDPCGAFALTTAALTATNVGATTTVAPVSIALTGLPVCGGSANQPKDVWYTFTPANASVTLTFTGAAAGAVRLFSLSGTCSTGTYSLVGCQAATNATTSVGTVTFPGLTPGARYYIAVSGYASTTASGSFTVTGTVLNARTQAETGALVVFPNPSNTGQLTLRLNAPAVGSATLLNALGQVVLTRTLNSSATEHQLNTAGLATGVYTLRVQQGNDVLTRKVVLE